MKSDLMMTGPSRTFDQYTSPADSHHCRSEFGILFSILHCVVDCLRVFSLLFDLYAFVILELAEFYSMRLLESVSSD